MNLFEKIKNSTTPKDMSLILEKMLEDGDYVLCSEETCSVCAIDGYHCQSCICEKLLKEVR